MKRLLLFPVWVLLCFASGAGWAADAELRSLIEALRSDRRMRGAVGLDGGDQPPLRAVMGTQRSSIFWVGSISKQFASAAALRLVADGRLGLHDPVAVHLSGLSRNDLRLEGEDCTLERLLSHQCGLSRGFLDPRFLGHLDDEDARAAFVNEVRSRGLGFRPGSEFAYSNAGYDLVGLLVQEASGRPYREVLREQLFEPLGMHDTGVRIDLRPQHQRRLAPGTTDLLLGFLPSPWAFFLEPTRPAAFGASGNVYSTVDDLHRWLGALHEGEVLPPELYQEMVRPRREDYGLGLYRLGEDAEQLILHNGAILPEGYASAAGYRPSDRRTFVVLAARPRPAIDPTGIALSLLAAEGSSVPAPPRIGGDVGSRLPGAITNGVFVLLVPIMAVAFVWRAFRPSAWQSLAELLSRQLSWEAMLFVATVFRSSLAEVYAVGAIVGGIGAVGAVRGRLRARAGGSFWAGVWRFRSFIDLIGIVFLLVMAPWTTRVFMGLGLLVLVGASVLARLRRPGLAPPTEA
jgi:CubicO group peptidase (beta-lactamase class C family)